MMLIISDGSWQIRETELCSEWRCEISANFVAWDAYLTLPTGNPSIRDQVAETIWGNDLP